MGLEFFCRGAIWGIYTLPSVFSLFSLIKSVGFKKKVAQAATERVYSPSGNLEGSVPARDAGAIFQSSIGMWLVLVSGNTRCMDSVTKASISAAGELGSPCSGIPGICESRSILLSSLRVSFALSRR